MNQITATQGTDPLADLNDMQAAFVVKMVEGTSNQRDCAIAAGYSPNTADVAGSKLMRNPKVTSAIYALSVIKLAGHVPMALNTVARLSETGKSEYVKYIASKDILDRVGMLAPKQVQVSGNVSVEIDLS